MNEYQIPCPYCGQDWLRLVRVRATGDVIRICSECETVRTGDDEETDTSFDNYAAAHGIASLWDELERIE